MERTEINQIYEQAYKKGRQQWGVSTNRGDTGYLTSLDGIVPNGEVLSEVSLGLVEIPLRKIIGTYSHSRSISFANNFMPIMAEETEFARKWMDLYAIHIKEGIRDPIKVYEYMNRFFVVEGNKRVSVLKYVGAISINAYVTRMIPKRDTSNKNNNIYFEFMEFYKETKINTIWFSEEGRFKELLSFINHYVPTVSVADSNPKDFLAHIYTPFREMYLREGGQRLSITTGDALLNFLKIYGLPTEISPTLHLEAIKNVIQELDIITTDEANVQEAPLPTVAPKKRKMFGSLVEFMGPKKILKVAFVYAKSPDTSGWANSHELGRQHIDNIFKEHIETITITNVPENENAYPILEDLARQKYDIVFTTSPTFVAPALKAAMSYPQTKFLNCGATRSYKSLTLYFGRIHEPKYLLGMIAGAITQTNEIGYVAPYPISEVISSINAFTLGARAVNPYVKVRAKWSYRWDNSTQGKDVEAILLQEGVDIIANDDLPIPGQASKQYGVYKVNKETGEKTHYAMAIWNWGVFYEKVIANTLNGTWEIIEGTTDKEDIPRNFWLGMDTGIVDILYSNRQLNPQTKYLLNQLKKAIMQHDFHVFRGPIYDQSQQLRIKEKEQFGYEEIINMDWLVEGVDASLPEMTYLTPSDPFLFMRNITENKE